MSESLPAAAPYGTQCGEASPYSEATTRYLSGTTTFWEFKGECDTIDSFRAPKRVLPTKPVHYQPNTRAKTAEARHVAMLEEKERQKKAWLTNYYSRNNIPSMGIGPGESRHSMGGSIDAPGGYNIFDALHPIEVIPPRYPLGLTDVTYTVDQFGKEQTTWDALSQYTPNEIRAHLGMLPVTAEFVPEDSPLPSLYSPPLEDFR